MSDEVLTTPIDHLAAAGLASQHLRFDLVPRDTAALDLWIQAIGRGFHGAALADDALPARRDGFSARRICGVWDDSILDAATPIATASSWIMEVTVPGRRGMPTWAISTISVAPTHRRRGIARHLLEAELRTAVELGVPAAILTASEATIYERFGFAPAAMRGDWTIDTVAAKWTGRVPDGRLQIITSTQARDEGGFGLVQDARLAVPGQVDFGGMLWTRMFGSPVPAADVRVVRYDDGAGQARGLAIYAVKETGNTASVEVRYLTAVTDDAYSALWRYLIELDLVSEVRADLRSTDEAFRWQISDFRAATLGNVHDHLWLRILDVRVSLEARRYESPGIFEFEVADDLGFAEGCYLLSIDFAGVGTVRRLDDSGPFGEHHHLQLGVNELSAAFLGATSFETLVRAGRVIEKTEGAAAAADAAFRSAVTPWTSIWF